MVTAAAATGCGDGSPCDPGQRYERGLCYAPDPEPDAGVASDDAGHDAGARDGAAIATAGQRPAGDQRRSADRTDGK